MTSAPVLTNGDGGSSGGGVRGGGAEVALRTARGSEGAGSRVAANGGVRARGGAGGRRGDRGRPLPRRRGPGVAVEEAEARRGVGAETEARRGGGVEAEWRPVAAAAAKSIWAEARIEGEGNGRGCVIYIGVPL